MPTNQQINKIKLYSRASGQQRFIAGGVFLFIALFFGFLALGGWGKIDLDNWLGPCGFKQQYNLPCPSCGMTTSAIAFAKGQIFMSFYIQPAAGLLCTVFLISGILAFFIAAFGIYFSFLNHIFKEANIKYILLALIVIIAAGWAVTLARAIVENTSGKG